MDSYMEDKSGSTWSEMIAFIKDFNLFLLALLIPLNKAINKYFEYQKSKDKEAIREVVTDALRGFKDEIRNDLKEIKQTQADDRKQFNNDIKEVLKQIRK